MCVGYLALQTHREYPFIAAFNRDEFFSRRSEPAHYWQEQPNLLAGKDLVGGGSWMGITRGGRFAVVTNIRTGKAQEPARTSRGRLVLDYLEGSQNPEEFLDGTSRHVDLYSPFNLIVGSIHRLCFFNSRSLETVSLPRGIHGLSNGTLNDPWVKIEKGKQFLVQSLHKSQVELTEGLLELLSDRTLAPKTKLPSTGVSAARELQLSSIFVSLPDIDYGTRSSTVIIIDKNGQGTFVELTHLRDPDAPPERREFRLFLG